MARVCRVTVGIGGHLGGAVETWYNGHFLESVRVTLVRTHNNGKCLRPGWTFMSLSNPSSCGK